MRPDHPHRVLSSSTESIPGSRQPLPKGCPHNLSAKSSNKPWSFFLPSPLWKKLRREVTNKNGKYRTTYSVTEFEGAHLV
jgi:hypothetical protein